MPPLILSSNTLQSRSFPQASLDSGPFTVNTHFTSSLCQVSPTLDGRTPEHLSSPIILIRIIFQVYHYSYIFFLLINKQLKGRVFLKGSFGVDINSSVYFEVIIFGVLFLIVSFLIVDFFAHVDRIRVHWS